MSERECYGDELCGEGVPEFPPGRATRAGRRSGVTLPMAERASPVAQDADTALMEAAKAAPRRSSIIKVGAFVVFLRTLVGCVPLL